MNRTWTADLIRNPITGKNELRNERYEYLFCDDLWREVKSFLFTPKEDIVNINLRTASLNYKRDAPVELPEIIDTIQTYGSRKDKKFATQLRALVSQWGKKRPLNFYYSRPEGSKVDCDDAFCFLLSVWADITLHHRKKDLRQIRAEYIRFYRELQKKGKSIPQESDFVMRFWREKKDVGEWAISSKYLTQSLRHRISSKVIRLFY